MTADNNTGNETDDFEPHGMELLFWGEPSDATPENLRYDEGTISEYAPHYGLNAYLGETVRMYALPGENVAVTVKRLRNLAEETGENVCVRYSTTDWSMIYIHGMPEGHVGRLGAWTGLQIGQSIHWGYSVEREDLEVRRACRIARYLHRCGLGRYIVYLADDDQWGFWIRRVE